MKPLVSVVLTAYNRAEPLRRTLETLVNQTLDDFDLLVCDDASSDHTEAVVREFSGRDPRIRYHRNPRNLGMPENLNEGIRRTDGTFVANLHDGDLYDRGLLQKWSDALQHNPQAAFVFNQYRVLAADGRTVAVNREMLPPQFAGSQLLVNVCFKRWRFDFPVWGTVMARRSAYVAAGLFDPRFGCVADIDMWMRLAETHDIAYVSEPLINLVDHHALASNWKIPYDVVREIFWESRMRYYRTRPFARFREAMRHIIFTGASETYRNACKAKAALTK